MLRARSSSSIGSKITGREQDDVGRLSLEEGIAQWAAWYDDLPSEWRETLDDLGRLGSRDPESA